MGRKPWTEEEEEALRGGVAKHGPSKWTCILHDPEFGPPLLNRSNIDIKDKWRNLVARDYKGMLKSPKAVRKAATSRSAAAPPCSSAATTQTSGASSNAAAEEQPSTGSQDGEKGSRDILRQTSAAGQKKKKKKNIPKKNPARKEVKTKPLPPPSGVGKAAVGTTVRRSARIMFSRLKSIPSNNPDDPIVID